MSHSFSFKNIRTKKETSTESSDTCHVHYGMVFISGKFVSRMTCEASSFRVIQLIHTENWTASSVYFSTINGDLLLGMMKGEREKVLESSYRQTILQRTLMGTFVYQICFGGP